MPGEILTLDAEGLIQEALAINLEVDLAEELYIHELSNNCICVVAETPGGKRVTFSEIQKKGYSPRLLLIALANAKYDEGSKDRPITARYPHYKEGQLIGETTLRMPIAVARSAIRIGASALGLKTEDILRQMNARYGTGHSFSGDPEKDDLYLNSAVQALTNRE